MITTDEAGINHAIGAKWRLVYDEEKVLTIVEGTDNNQTSSTHEIEEFDTEQAVLDRIEELGLEYNERYEWFRLKLS